MTGTLSQVLTASATSNHLSEENRNVRDNAALMINNVAAIGGDEAVSVLCRCKPLVIILVDLLARHNDGAVVLKRFAGCFSHLSRSVQVCSQRFLVLMHHRCRFLTWPSFLPNVQSAQMLRRERVLAGLQKLMLRARTGASSEGSWQACNALATMALANLIGKEEDEEIYAPDHGLGGLTVNQYKKAVAAASVPDAVKGVVDFLKHAMRKENVHGISLRVYGLAHLRVHAHARIHACTSVHTSNLTYMVWQMCCFRSINFLEIRKSNKP